LQFAAVRTGEKQGMHFLAQRTARIGFRKRLVRRDQDAEQLQYPQQPQEPQEAQVHWNA